MFNLVKYPTKDSWKKLLQRSAVDTNTLQNTVSAVLNEVKQLGDIAIKKYTQQFDGVVIDNFKVSEEDIRNAENLLNNDLKQAIRQASENIAKFHQSQMKEAPVVETMKGVNCWRKSVGIEKVGIYVPGGTAPLFSTVLMLAIPAQIAGCKEIVLCTPPNKEGNINNAILYAAQITGVTAVYAVGGVQAIAAMAYGTATIPQVYKIFGPGNQYVTCAKQLVQQQGVAIDMPAGPSEVCILADETAVASFIAADLLSQAEHGADSEVLLVTINEELLASVNEELMKQLKNLSRKDIATKALENSKAILLSNINDAIDLVNQYAAEHLIIACKNANIIAQKIVNAGSVFLGNYSPESVGDYASGTNHTLPTNGFAKAYSGVSVDSFVKKITFQQLTQEGLLNIANTVELMAEAEGLDGHKNAVRVRREKIEETGKDRK